MPPRKRKLQVVSEQGQPFDLVGWVDALPDVFVQCRAYGHRWQPQRAWPLSPGYRLLIRCSRCKADRHLDLSDRGHVQASKYDHPEGYLAPKGAGYLATDQRDHLRLEAVLRMITKRETG